MKMASYRPQEARGAHEDVIFVLGEDLGRHHIFQRLRRNGMHVFDDPIERLKVSQTAFALFDIRLNQIARIALARVAIVALFQFVSNELRIFTDNSLRVEHISCRVG